MTCGCRVKAGWRDLHTGQFVIEYCPLHEAAPRLKADFSRQSDTIAMMNEKYLELEKLGCFKCRGINGLLKRENEVLKKTLKEISKLIDCDGPGCFFCCEENQNHPQHPSALIAERALKELDK